MAVEGVSNVSFGNLKLGYALRRNLAKKKLSRYSRQDLARVKRIIRENGLHKQKYVDIILEEKNYIDYADGMFYCTISSKKQGVPMNPDAQCIIGKDEKKIRYFIEWVKDWNEAYSPKALQERHNTIEKALLLMKKSGKKFLGNN